MPNHSLPRSGALFVLLLVAALLVASPVFAKTITVDGDPADWTQGVAQPPIATDANGATTPDNVDIGPVYFTNDTTNIYWRFDTYGITEWDSPSRATFCMNVDNNINTGATISTCNNLVGVDYVLEFSRPASATNPLNISDFEYCTIAGSCSNASPTGILGARQLPSGTVTEALIALSTLRLTNTGSPAPNGLPSSCTSANPCLIPSRVIFGTPSNRDSATLTTAGQTPQIPVVPTPVTLTAFSATRGENGVDLAWATSSELNIQGFHILRSAGGREAATRITAELIPGEGSGVTGGTYRFTDTGAAVGSSYSYWLEVINSDGTPEEYGPARYNPATAAPTLVYLPLVRQ